MIHDFCDEKNLLVSNVLQKLQLRSIFFGNYIESHFEKLSVGKAVIKWHILRCVCFFELRFFSRKLKSHSDEL